MSTITEAPVAGRSTGAARKASRTPYWLTVAIAAVGVGLALFWGVGSVNNANERAAGFPRTTVPGTATVNVTQSGDQMIYFTGSGEPNAQSLGLEVEGPDGAPIPTVPYSLALQVDLAGNVGTAIATFAADAPGAYTVSSTRSSYPGGVIAVGDNVSMDVLPHVLGALALMFFSVVGAVVIVVVTVLRRSARGS